MTHVIFEMMQLSTSMCSENNLKRSSQILVMLPLYKACKLQWKSQWLCININMGRDHQVNEVMSTLVADR